jgi:hypothetical protein
MYPLINIFSFPRKGSDYGGDKINYFFFSQRRRRLMTEIQNTETGMVERLSRVLCVCRGNNPNRRLEEYGQTSHSYWAWELYVDEVKALMKAMREPTGAMKEAGAVSFQMEDIDGQPTTVWTEMLDAAMEGSP